MQVQHTTKPAWNATLNADGSVTVYMTWGRVTESLTLSTEDPGYDVKKVRKSTPAKTTSTTQSVDPVANAALPKTKRLYQNTNGKWLSYARARQLGIA